MANTRKRKPQPEKKETLSLAEESGVAYAAAVPESVAIAGKIWALLGGKLFAKQLPGTSLEFYSAVKRGVPKISIDQMAEIMSVPMTKMAELLNLSYKTLTRKSKHDLLDVSVSSHAFEMAEVIARGLEVFETEGRFSRWLHKENFALHGARPLDLLDSPAGIRLVTELLGRIEEGVYS
ncbi:MAG TPA: antitoxin Xre/MbcA/ParS toxin-binding domain-containing protein [Puia sp.]|nr:antitoxin Xre/MbcA/ParS toxin-binding domain-containing protein [Puia sp.]